MKPLLILLLLFGSCGRVGEGPLLTQPPTPFPLRRKRPVPEFGSVHMLGNPKPVGKESVTSRPETSLKYSGSSVPSQNLPQISIIHWVGSSVSFRFG